MKTPLFILLQILAGIIVLGSCYYHARDYRLPMALEVLGTGLVLTLATCAWAHWRRATRADFGFPTLWPLLLWLTLSFTITIGAINALPIPDVFDDPFVISIAVVFRLTCYGQAIYITWAALTRRPKERLAGVGLVPILTFSLLNNRFYIETQRYTEPFLMGLVLVTLLVHLADDTSSRRQEPVWHGLNLPILLLVATAGLSTIFSFYPLQSLDVWLRLVYWVLVYFIITKAVRRPEQLKRILVVLVVLAGPVFALSLSRLLNHGLQVGWQEALQTRLATGNIPVNGLAHFCALYLNLCAGLLLACPGRGAKWGLGLVMVFLCLCLVLTYSRGGLVGLACGLACFFALTVYVSNKANPDRQQAKALWQRVRHVLATDRRWVIIPVLVLFLAMATALLKLNREGANIDARLYLWKVALAMIWQYPVLGSGPGVHFLPSFAQVLTPSEFITVQNFIAWTGAHNLLLEIGQGLGLTGLGLFIWLLLAASRDCGQRLKHARSAAQGYLLIGLAAAAVTWLACNIFGSLLGETFWVLLGLTVVAAHLHEHKSAALVSKAVTAPGRVRLGLAVMVLVAVALVVARPIALEAKKKQFFQAYMQRQWAQAKNAAQACIWLQPLDPEFWVALSKLAGSQDEAIVHQRRAVSLRPAYARYHVRLGWLYWRQNRPELARAAFEEAVRVDPLGLQWESHQPDLGLLYAGLGKKDPALAAFAASLPDSVKQPDWMMTAKGIGLHPAYTRYAATGQVDQALAKLIDYHLNLAPANALPRENHETVTFFLQDIEEKVLPEARATFLERPARASKIFNSLIHIYTRFGDQRTAKTLTDELNALAQSFPAH